MSSASPRWLPVIAVCVAFTALAISLAAIGSAPDTMTLGAVHDVLATGRTTDSRSPAMIAYAKSTEATVAVTELAWGVALCAERAGALPAGTTKVPVDLAKVRGMAYQSAPEDWATPAFECAGFHMLRPQRFRYEWTKLSETEGRVGADADFDGDDVVDHAVELHVRCTRTDDRFRCRPDRMTTEPSPFQVR
jgi:hypothetical protein